MALRDIELALTSGYPEDKAFKLEERKGELTSFSREPQNSSIYCLLYEYMIDTKVFLVITDLAGSVIFR